MKPSTLLISIILSLAVQPFFGSAASCPVDRPSPEPSHKVCSNGEVNVTVVRSHVEDEVHINYNVDRRMENRHRIAIHIHLRGQTRTEIVRCQNESFFDIIRVTFMKNCEDPVVIVNKMTTVKLQVEVEVTFSYMDIECTTILIGPQRLNLSCQVDPNTGQCTPFVQLLHVDNCSRIGPAVPINISTINSSITLYPNNTNLTMGNISVKPLPCSESHTQEYKVSVPITGDYTVTAHIPDTLLPKSCIPVTESNCSAVPTPLNDPSTITQTLVIAIPTAVVGVVILAVAVTIIVIVIVCVRWRHRKQRSSGMYDLRDSSNTDRTHSEAQNLTTDAMELGDRRRHAARPIGQSGLQRSEVGNGGADDDDSARLPTGSTGHHQTATVQYSTVCSDGTMSSSCT